MSASEQALHDFWRSRPSLMSASVSKRFLSSSTSALLRKLIGYVSMKPKLALWTLLLFVPAASAAAITCNAGAALSRFSIQPAFWERLAITPWIAPAGCRGRQSC